MTAQDVDTVINSLKESVNIHFFSKTCTYVIFYSYPLHLSRFDLNLYKFYNKNIEDIISKLNYHEKCSNCFMEDPTVLKICCNVKEICQKWNALCNNFGLSTRNCNDFFFKWLYGIIKKSNCSAREIIYFYSNIREHWKCRKTGNESVEKYLQIINNNTISYKKDFYDFLKYYSTINDLLSKKVILDKTPYCKYLDYIFRIYKKIHEDHNAFYSGIYDEDIKHFKKMLKHDNIFKYFKESCPNVKLELILEEDNIKIQDNISADITEKTLKYFKTTEIENLWKTSQLYNIYLELNVTCDSNQLTLENFDTLNHKDIKDNYFSNTFWKNLEGILDKWYNILKKYKYLSSNKICDYFNYWLYDKLKDTPNPRNLIPFLYKLRELFIINGHCNSKIYDFRIDQIKKKKALYEFLELYEILKVRLYKIGNEGTTKYCDYIEEMFDLYKDMERDRINLRGYSEEIKYFQEKFLQNSRELTFLSIKCPGRCLKYIFSDKYKKNCNSTGPASSDQKGAEEQCSEHRKFDVSKSEDENVNLF
ncbi:variable surface protein [Plasmodium gonderi]|uniref:Variable surface protein n=1 Tax=Plasmodium gonderi TaxID=77519 RepID=A0A1Y1JT85_PLAGO|nr:variable surface protein [Plasmodium gonderi]GAW84665.1 variable surface protein [Plasmodium gonderi]